MPFKETITKNNQEIENSDNTSSEVFELKEEIAEEIAEEIVDKLSKNSANSVSSLKKWAIKKYLLNNEASIDIIYKFIIWGFWGLFWLLPPDIDKYKWLLAEADTKNKLEELRKDFLNEVWWTEQVSSSAHESSTPSESSDIVDNSWIVEKACQIAVDIANDNSYWYESGGTGDNNGRKWFDCQGFVRRCYIETWINVPPSWWCGTMKEDFEKAWFECITFNHNEKLKPWDILLDPKKHTEMCIWENKIAWAHFNKDKKAWDGSWDEISVRSVKSSLSYRNPKYILRYKWDLA